MMALALVVNGHEANSVSKCQYNVVRAEYRIRVQTQSDEESLKRDLTAG